MAKTNGAVYVSGSNISGVKNNSLCLSIQFPLLLFSPRPRRSQTWIKSVPFRAPSLQPFSTAAEMRRFFQLRSAGSAPPFRAKECRRGRRSQGPRAPWNPFAAQTELGRTAAIRRIPHHGDAVDTAETQFGASNPTPWSFVAQHRRSHPTLMDQSTHQSTSSHAKWALNSGFHRPVHAPS